MANDGPNSNGSWAWWDAGCQMLVCHLVVLVTSKGFLIFLGFFLVFYGFLWFSSRVFHFPGLKFSSFSWDTWMRHWGSQFYITTAKTVGGHSSRDLGFSGGLFPVTKMLWYSCIVAHQIYSNGLGFSGRLEVFFFFFFVKDRPPQNIVFMFFCLVNNGRVS